MNAIKLTLVSLVAASSAGVLLFYVLNPAAEAEPVLQPAGVIGEQPMEGFLSLQEPVIEKKQLAAPAQPAVAPEAESAALPVEPVQPIEDRGDAMLFEAEALNGTPFDQSITMPFD
ncbi:hypothetical protein [Pontiella sp.]|uniref:hypothetical protein n=1 Tax=Pontiella sp. TaxID=2837462 RepID=UPI003562F1FF